MSDFLAQWDARETSGEMLNEIRQCHRLKGTLQAGRGTMNLSKSLDNSLLYSPFCGQLRPFKASLPSSSFSRIRHSTHHPLPTPHPGLQAWLSLLLSKDNLREPMCSQILRGKMTSASETTERDLGVCTASLSTYFKEGVAILRSGW